MRIRFFALASLAVLSTLAGCSSPTSTNATVSTTESPSASTVTGSPSIGHVFVINLENKSYGETWGPDSVAAYLNGTLRPQGQLLEQYFGIGHASLGNYLAQVSGQAPNSKTQSDCFQFVEFNQTGTGDYGQALGEGCVYPPAIKTVADQLTSAGKTWKSYQEDLANSSTEPKTCRHPMIGTADATVGARQGDMYTTRHNPFVYFHSIIDSPSCADNVVDLSALSSDLASEATTPNLTYITPTLCHDGHDAPCIDGQPGGLTSADQFLATTVPDILSSTAFQTDGMLIITFDEAELIGDHADSSACCNTPRSPNAPNPGLAGPGGGRIGALVLAANVAPASVNATPYNHYSLLCSIEDIFDLPHLGFAGAPGLACFGNDVYGN
ncbi:MAG: alkaline phosphatase family protein [Actinomycetes bacterium]